MNRPLGTPLGKHPTRVLFLGAGELGKEVAIELMRLGAWVCAADSYAGAPAQQVAHEYRVLDMANAAELQALFDEVKPDIIVPEVEAIATDMLAGAAAAGAQVVPSAEIAAICMDRERLRVLAHEELGLPTTPYRFAGSLEELRAGALEVGYPCVVKPVMSSSGHGQSVVRSANAIDAAWTEAQKGRRAADEGDVSRVIVEALAPLERELTVLTVSSSAGIVTCAPIGQRQESGDYRESWQPAAEPSDEFNRAQTIARTAVEDWSLKPRLLAKPAGACSAWNCSYSPMVRFCSTRSPPPARYRHGDDGLPAPERIRVARPCDSRVADYGRACGAEYSNRLGGGKPCDCGGRRWRSEFTTWPPPCPVLARICVFLPSPRYMATAAWPWHWRSANPKPMPAPKPAEWPMR